MSDTTPKLSVSELEELIFKIDIMLLNESVK
jgi:hypothetical protein